MQVESGFRVRLVLRGVGSVVKPFIYRFRLISRSTFLGLCVSSWN